MAQQLGPYLLEAELGRGGMGVVWRAHDPALDRTVAIKVVLTALAGPEELARFRREALAQARLRHPAIVGVHTVGTTPTGQPYLVMDHVEGESLAERLQRDGPLPPAQAAQVVARLARAVQYAHARGVLHRDLKARNVLLDPAGEPILIDFGLAALAGRERLTATGEAVGTPGCMAPEQAQADRARVGPKSDVYGLGAVLHEALTGRAPFEGKDPLATLAAVVDLPAQPPSRLRPGLDPRLDAIVLRCLEKDPARRFPSADALADALEALGPRAGPAPPAAGRGPGLAIAGLVLGLLGGALAARALGPAPAAHPPDPTTTAAPTSSTAPPPVDLTPGQGALAAVRAGDLDGARALADRALATPAAADLARALVARAAARGRTGDVAGAVEDGRAAEAVSSAPELTTERAMLRLLSGDPVGATRDLDRLKATKDPKLLAELARILVLVADDAAPDVTERAVVATDERDAEALAARAFTRASRSRAAALRDAEAALKLDATCVLALVVRALQRPEREEEDLKAALARAEELKDPLASSMVLCARASRVLTGPVTDASLQAALADLDRAASYAPGSPRVIDQRTAIVFQLAARRPAERRRLLEQALVDARRLTEALVSDTSAAELEADVRLGLALDPQRGLDAAEAGRAEAVLTRALERTPGDPSLLVARADLRASLGDFAGAELDARAVIEPPADQTFDPQAVAVLARTRWRRGAVVEARELLDEVLDHVPPRDRSAYALAERAVVLALLREPEAARADAAAALAMEPRLARAHFARARALMVSGGGQDVLNGAAAALGAALDLDPTLAVALADRGYVRGMAHPREGEVDLRLAIQLEPWAAEHHVALAIVLGPEGGGGQELERALLLDPASCSARANRGRWLVQRGDPRSALGDLAFACERQPWIPDPWSWLGLARQQLGDDAGALEAADRCLERLAPTPTGPAAGRACRIRAAVLHQRKQDALALKEADRALAMDPTEPDGLPVRAQLRAATGDLDGALEDLDEFLRRRPRSALGRLDRAELFLLREEPARARQEVEALLPALKDPALARRAQAILDQTRR